MNVACFYIHNAFRFKTSVITKKQDQSDIILYIFHISVQIPGIPRLTAGKVDTESLKLALKHILFCLVKTDDRNHKRCKEVKIMFYKIR